MNAFLGEVEVEIDGRKFTLRPSFDGIMEMETRAGESLSLVVNHFLKNQISAKELVATIYGGILGAPDKNKEAPQFEELGQMIMKHGFSKLIAPALKLVTSAYTGVAIPEEGASEKKPEGESVQA